MSLASSGLELPENTFMLGMVALLLHAEPIQVLGVLAGAGFFYDFNTAHVGRVLSTLNLLLLLRVWLKKLLTTCSCATQRSSSRRSGRRMEYLAADSAALSSSSAMM